MTRLEDLADSTLFDENTKFILIDDANKEIPSNMTMHVLADLTLIDENTKLILIDDAKRK